MSPINMPNMSAALQIDSVLALGKVIDQLKAAQLALMAGKTWQGSALLSEGAERLATLDQKLVGELGCPSAASAASGDDSIPFTFA